MYNFWKRPFTLYIWGFLSIYHWTLSLWKVNGKRRQRAVCFIELLSSILFFLKIWYSIDNYFCIAIIPLLLKFSRKSILFVHTDSYIRSIVAAWWAYVLCRSDLTLYICTILSCKFSWWCRMVWPSCRLCYYVVQIETVLRGVPPACQ